MNVLKDAVRLFSGITGEKFQEPNGQVRTGDDVMKTRAFDPIENRWRTDYIVKSDGSVWNTNLRGDGFNYKQDWKLSRFTGQLDEDGTEIYEHSIVECCIMEDINMDEGIVWGPTIRDVVIFDTNEGMFRLSRYKGIPLVQHSLIEFVEVVGSIFENPELLEEVNR